MKQYIIFCNKNSLKASKFSSLQVYKKLEMKTKEITAYFCDHCNKLYQRKHFAIKHEERCFKNPANFRPCLSCSHCEYIESSILEDAYGNETSEKVKAFWCAKKKIYLIPPIAQHKNNEYVFEDAENFCMPKHCFDYDGFEKLPF